MSETISDRKDMDFVIYEQLNTNEIFKTKKFHNVNKKTSFMIIKEAYNFAMNEILPTYVEADREGVKFENGEVKVPKCFKKAHKLLIEGEWGAITESFEYGGQELPHIIAQAVWELMIGANYTLMTYPILGHGAGKMIETFGTDKQKELFLKKLYSLEWGGSMLLTESEAGSDLGALTTSAVKNDDGTYSITGSKIFITNGEQDLTKNIIHPVLARVEGAPEGIKGISIFIVPKFWVEDDGKIGDFNDVVCTGVEEKMGLHGSPTCFLSLGAKGKCKGLLLGRENQGIEIMFNMMNKVRLEVGTQAFTYASRAYLYALDYARTRKQGKTKNNKEDRQVTIINHPDVKRMLFKMKAYVEGMRSLIYFTALNFDKKHIAESKDEKKHYSNLINILTPIVKAYCSEKGFDVCVESMQVLGGYGYIKDYPVEQFLRDSKITSIYEGTNGIQAIDFVLRKIVVNDSEMLNSLIKEIQKTIEEARAFDELSEMAEKLARVTDALFSACFQVTKKIKEKKIDSALFSAHPLLEATGDVIMAWMLIWRASVAIKNLKKIKKDKSIEEIANESKDASFYYGKIVTAKFFVNNMLPSVFGKFTAVMLNDNVDEINCKENIF